MILLEGDFNAEYSEAFKPGVLKAWSTQAIDGDRQLNMAKMDREIRFWLRDVHQHLEEIANFGRSMVLIVHCSILIAGGPATTQ